MNPYRICEIRHACEILLLNVKCIAVHKDLFYYKITPNSLFYTVIFFNFTFPKHFVIIKTEVNIMKRIIALFLVFLLLFCGCGNKLTELTIEDNGSFSSEELDKYLKNDNKESGVIKDGFVNTEKTEIKDIYDAVETAKKEITHEKYAEAFVKYTNDKEFYLVLFSLGGDTLGGCATVYMDKSGITKCIVYGE